jgi:hypothetical protein
MRMTQSKVTGLRSRQCLGHALEEFLGERFGTSGDVEVKIVDDLILLRCKGAASHSFLKDEKKGLLKARRMK